VPISRREFNAGQGDLDGVVESILRENRDLAYTLTEIAIELGAFGFTPDFDEIDAALARLLQRRRVESKSIKDYEGAESIYYSYSRSIGFSI